MSLFTYRVQPYGTIPPNYIVCPFLSEFEDRPAFPCEIPLYFMCYVVYCYAVSPLVGCVVPGWSSTTERQCTFLFRPYTFVPFGRVVLCTGRVVDSKVNGRGVMLFRFSLWFHSNRALQYASDVHLVNEFFSSFGLYDEAPSSSYPMGADGHAPCQSIVLDANQIPVCDSPVRNDRSGSGTGSRIRWPLSISSSELASMYPLPRSVHCSNSAAVAGKFSNLLHIGAVILSLAQSSKLDALPYCDDTILVFDTYD